MQSSLFFNQKYDFQKAYAKAHPFMENKKVSDKKGKYASSYAQLITRTTSRINKGQLVE